ncbi:hypothetical protein [Iamia sp.]|uniref:hypothetical protein n=1 Tax=Iamia sp. TaxID=2722710 RepID=UPI002C97621E|nr:hypothetical protein [Iamia sp.]HXH57557.1 hypothetical protein [Iamia sp.]
MAAPSGPKARRGWPLTGDVALAVAVVGGGLVRASAGFGWVGLIQLFLVLPWLAPILWVAAHLYSRGPAVGDRTLRALLLGGTLALAGSSITVDYTDRRDCFLGACHGVDEPRPWWEAGGTRSTSRPSRRSACRWRSPPWR